MMICSTKWAVPISFVLLAALNDVALSQTRPVLRIGPDHADSNCIDDATTPLCAVESWIACLVRQEKDLCRRLAPQIEMRFRPNRPAYVAEYQVAEILAVTPGRITKGLREFGIMSGDVEVRIRKRGCPVDQLSCEDVSPSKVVYFLRQSEDRWRLIAWTHEHAPETCDDFDPEIDPRQDCRIFIWDAEEPWVHDRKIGYDWE